MGTLDAWYDHLEVGHLLDLVAEEVRRGALSIQEARHTHGYVAKARTRDNVRVFAKRAATVDGELRIVAEPPLIVPIEDLVEPGSEWDQAEPLIKRQLASYRRTLGREHHPIEEYRYVHAARKVVGVGSVGTRCYILLLLGRDERDPLFLQVKEAQASVLERFVEPSAYRNHGQRVVVGQHLMQAASDLFLGWQRIKGLDGKHRDYYVRQLHDWKGGPDVETMLVPGATLYARICAATLARAHARWGDRVAIAAYLGKGPAFDRAVADFAAAYADQNERDYEAFAEAARSGRLAVETGR
jgi:nitroreductase